MSKGEKQEETRMEKQKIDLIVIGNQNSGKTSLIKRFVEGEKVFSHNYNPTLGINLEKREIVLDNMLISVNIWDTAGQEKFLALTKHYFKKADGVMVIFDLTDINSYEKVSKFWIHEVEEKATEETCLIIIGNKVDMEKERVVKFEQAKRMAQGLKFPYFETSAKTGENVEQAINYIVRECLKKIKQQPGIHLNSTSGVDRSGSCIGNIKDLFSSIFKSKDIN